MVTTPTATKNADAPSTTPTSGAPQAPSGSAPADWYPTLTELIAQDPAADAPTLSSRLADRGYPSVTPKQIKNKLKKSKAADGGSLRQAGAEKQANLKNDIEQLFEKFAEEDVARGFGMQQPHMSGTMATQPVFTWPEDAFLGNPNKLSSLPDRPSEFRFQLPAFEKVLSANMYRSKTQNEEDAHCKHTNHMFLYLMRKSGGAPKGVRHCISAPYFNTTEKQVFHSLIGQHPSITEKPMLMPQMVRDNFEPRGWVLYKDFLAELDKFFVPSPAHENDKPLLDVLDLDLDLSGYAYGGSSGHGLLVFKLRFPNNPKPIFKVLLARE